MSSSAVRRKSYKKAQEDAGPYWEGDSASAGGGEVTAGKLQVMEKFFSPVEDEHKGLSDRHRRTDNRFATAASLSSSSSTFSSSGSSASWSSDASFDKEAFSASTDSRYPRQYPQHSQSCIDVSRGGRKIGNHDGTSQIGDHEETAHLAEMEASSFARLQKGHSKSVDRLMHRRQATVDRQIYKATSLVFNAETSRNNRRNNTPNKGILKNGEDRMWKAKSIETITVRPTMGKEVRGSTLGPARPLQRRQQPPNSLDLSTPQKPSLSTERLRRVEEKLRFSEFLNEITKQVMSPSSLNSLGWKPPGSAPVSKAPSTEGSSSSPGSVAEVKAKKYEGASPAVFGRRRTGKEVEGSEAHEEGGAPKRGVKEAGGEKEAQAKGKELLSEDNAEQLLSPEAVALPSSPEQSDLQRTWEELENLKGKFSRLQEEYSDTRLTNQLLEEKLHIIAGSMAEERQALNQRINELLERLISAQNTINALEKINISGLVCGQRRRQGVRPDTPDSLSSLLNLEVAPPAAFMDGAPEAALSQSDSAPEAGKPNGSSGSESGGGARHRGRGHGTHTAFAPWKPRPTRFPSETVNSTESECSGEEMVPLCGPTFTAPRFLYLRQEALVAPTGAGDFPPLASMEPSGPGAFPPLHSISPGIVGKG
nr:uncharacterized protein LOC132764540 [Anolis sagrei ordinatus]